MQQNVLLQSSPQLEAHLICARTPSRVPPGAGTNVSYPSRQARPGTQGWESTRRKAKVLRLVKDILAASSRRDWEADGSRLWRYKEDPELTVVDLTGEERAIERHWARRMGLAAFGVELSIFYGPTLVTEVAAVSVDGGRALIPWPRENGIDGLTIARWRYDLCKAISPGEYFGFYPVDPYLRMAGITVS